MTKTLSVASIIKKVKSFFKKENDSSWIVKNDISARKLLTRSRNGFYNAIFEYKELGNKSVNLYQDELKGLADVRSKASALLSSIRLCAIRMYLEDIEHSDLSEQAKARDLSQLLSEIEDILPQAEKANIFQEVA